MSQDFLYRGVKLSLLAVEELEQAKAQVKRTLRIMEEGEKSIRELVPKYRSSSSVKATFEQYESAIEAELMKRKEAR